MFRYSPKSLKTVALGMAAALATIAGNASAAIDTTAITGAITEGQAAAVLVAVAFGVAVWAVKGVKLVRRG